MIMASLVKRFHRIFNDIDESRMFSAELMITSCGTSVMLVLIFPKTPDLNYFQLFTITSYLHLKTK